MTTKSNEEDLVYNRRNIIDINIALPKNARNMIDTTVKVFDEERFLMKIGDQSFEFFRETKELKQFAKALELILEEANKLCQKRPVVKSQLPIANSDFDSCSKSSRSNKENKEQKNEAK